MLPAIVRILIVTGFFIPSASVGVFARCFAPLAGQASAAPDVQDPAPSSDAIGLRLVRPGSGRRPGSESAQAAQSGPLRREQIPAGMTEIDGSRNPELIPDHAIWRLVFLKLTEIRRRGEEGDLVYLLPLNKADLAALFVEAMKQPERDEACSTRHKALQQEQSQAGASAAAMWQALDELAISCRTQDLDAGDRVMDGLSDDGRRILGDYIEARRRSMSMLVPDRELKTYRLPR